MPNNLQIDEIVKKIAEGEALLQKIPLLTTEDQFNKFITDFRKWFLLTVELIKNAFGIDNPPDNISSWQIFEDKKEFSVSNLVWLGMISAKTVMNLHGWYKNLESLLAKKENNSLLEIYLQRFRNVKIIVIPIIIFLAIAGIEPAYNIGKDILERFRPGAKEIASKKLWNEMGIKLAIQYKDGKRSELKESQIMEMIGDSPEILKEDGFDVFQMIVSADVTENMNAVILEFDKNFYDRLGGNKNQPEGWITDTIINNNRIYRSTGMSAHRSFRISQISQR